MILNTCEHKIQYNTIPINLLERIAEEEESRITIQIAK